MDDPFDGISDDDIATFILICLMSLLLKMMTMQSNLETKFVIGLKMDRPKSEITSGEDNDDDDDDDVTSQISIG